MLFNSLEVVEFLLRNLIGREKRYRMKFGGLSENEVEKISKILSSESIPFEVGSDEAIVNFNENSIKNDLRHFSPPNISTHMLSITIADEDFGKISKKSKEHLLDFGITDQAPLPEDFTPHSGHVIQEDLAKNQNRIIAFNLKHQIIIGLLILGIIWAIKTFH